MKLWDYLSSRLLIGPQPVLHTWDAETDTQAHRRLARKAYANAEATRIRKCREWFETANG